MKGMVAGILVGFLLSFSTGLLAQHKVGQMDASGHLESDYVVESRVKHCKTILLGNLIGFDQQIAPDGGVIATYVIQIKRVLKGNPQNSTVKAVFRKHGRQPSGGTTHGEEELLPWASHSGFELFVKVGENYFFFFENYFFRPGVHMINAVEPLETCIPELV